MRKVGYILIMLLVLFACADEVKPTVETIEKLELTFPQKMELFLDEPHLLHIGIDKTVAPYFIDYYKERGYQPRWIEKDTLWTKEATNLRSILKNKAQFGLPEKRYNFLKIDTNSIIGTLKTQSKANSFKPNNDINENYWFTLNRDDIFSYTGKNFSRYIIYLNGDYKAPKPKVITSNISNNHKKYAITWFSMAISILLIYLYFRKKNY